MGNYCVYYTLSRIFKALPISPADQHGARLSSISIGFYCQAANDCRSARVNFYVKDVFFFLNHLLVKSLFIHSFSTKSNTNNWNNHVLTS